MRQDRQFYRVYHVDILAADGRVVSRKVVETNDGLFKLEGDSEENAFQKLTDLISARLTPGVQLNQLAPCEYEKTGLQLCKEISDDEMKDETDFKGALLNPKAVRLEGPVLRSRCQQRVIKVRYIQTVSRKQRGGAVLSEHIHIEEGPP